MSFEKFKELGYDITEKDIKRYEALAKAEYETAYRNIRAAVQAQYAKLASTDISSRDFYNEMLKYNRLQKLEKKIAFEISKATTNVEAILERSLNAAFTNNFYYQTYASKWLAPAFSFVYVPDELATLVSVNTEQAWKRITERIEKMFGKKELYRAQHATLTELLVKNKNIAVQEIRSALTQGLLQGKQARQVMQDIRGIIGGTYVKNGIISENGLVYNSMRIARTEMTRVMNDGAFAAAKVLQSQGIKAQKKWLATLDKRTRPVHAALDGQVQDVDDPFISSAGAVMRPGQFRIASQDIHCRCTIIDIVEDISPQIRRGRNPTTGKNEVFSYRDFPEWAAENNLKRNKFGKLVPSKKSS